MLINLRDKMTRLNGVITPEAVDRLKDELGGIFTVVKRTTTNRGKNMAISQAPSLKQNTVSSSRIRRGRTRYPATQELTPRRH